MRPYTNRTILMRNFYLKEIRVYCRCGEKDYNKLSVFVHIHNTLYFNKKMIDLCNSHCSRKMVCLYCNITYV